MSEHFEIRVGMIEADDEPSTPRGSVVIDLTDTCVTTAQYTIPNVGIGKWEPVVSSIWVRYRGLDTMPRISGYADTETCGAIRDFLIANKMNGPEAFVAFCEGGQFGETFKERFRKRYAR